MLQMDMTTIDSLSHLTDDQLTARVQMLVNDERRTTVSLIASLSEFDARQLYLAEGCSSLYTYCTQVLHLSEHAAYGRIEAARAARRFPALLEHLAEGSLTLTTLGLLAAHLTDENHCEVLMAAQHKTKREVELLVATLRPQPPVPTRVRKVAAPKPVASPAASTDVPLLVCDDTRPNSVRPTRPAAPVSQTAVAVPLSGEYYKLQVTLSADTYALLCRAQALMRHVVPDGALSDIVDSALKLLVRELEQAKFAATDRPRQPRDAQGSSRYIPADVRRQVWHRDGGRCAFVGRQGRCTERGFLEFHHVQPYARGGPATLENVELRCRAHNEYESGLEFGPLFAREASADSDDSVRTEFGI